MFVFSPSIPVNGRAGIQACVLVGLGSGYQGGITEAGQVFLDNSSVSIISMYYLFRLVFLLEMSRNSREPPTSPGQLLLSPPPPKKAFHTTDIISLHLGPPKLGELSKASTYGEIEEMKSLLARKVHQRCRGCDCKQTFALFRNQNGALRKFQYLERSMTIVRI